MSLTLTLTQARAALDSGFVLDLTPPLTLWLREVNPVTGPGEAFSMIFHAPAEPALSQQTYRLRHETLGEQWLFLVPLSEGGEGAVYEALFNN
ncbi:DUF6916 family protein [Alloalcanivorax sp. C16-1]|uniref:DUF6916 family protein n=1 Tax=Alloalcanivorax sp. C16-1 TaxID=3390051 RepID=UPI003970EB0F